MGVYDTQKKVYRRPPKYSINGVSDILGILPGGRFLAIEVKAPDNKDRPQHQIDFLNNVNKDGGLGFFADNLETVVEKIKETTGRGGLLV